MEHREERELSIVIHLSATFSAEYEGDDDGYEWYEHFDREVKPELVRAIFGTLRAHPRFAALPAPRGGDPQSVVEIDVTYRP